MSDLPYLNQKPIRMLTPEEIAAMDVSHIRCRKDALERHQATNAFVRGKEVKDFTFMPQQPRQDIW